MEKNQRPTMLSCNAIRDKIAEPKSTIETPMILQIISSKSFDQEGSKTKNMKLKLTVSDGTSMVVAIILSKAWD